MTKLEQIKSEILTGLWTDLAPHLERGALFLVAEDLDLAVVGLAVVEDQTKDVAGWINDKNLDRPTLAQIKRWSNDTGKSFRFLIVAPYVLMQELSH